MSKKRTLFVCNTKISVLVKLKNQHGVNDLALQAEFQKWRKQKC